MMLGGVVGILYVVLKLILFVGLVIFTLECLWSRCGYTSKRIVM